MSNTKKIKSLFTSSGYNIKKKCFYKTFHSYNRNKTVMQLWQKLWNICTIHSYLHVFNNRAPYDIEKPISLNQHRNIHVNTLASKYPVINWKQMYQKWLILLICRHLKIYMSLLKSESNAIHYYYHGCMHIFWIFHFL